MATSHSLNEGLTSLEHSTVQDLGQVPLGRHTSADFPHWKLYADPFSGWEVATPVATVLGWLRAPGQGALGQPPVLF